MTAADPLQGLAVLERGWLSSNNVLIHAEAGEAGACLIDTGHARHADQTLALVRHALAQRPDQALAVIVNTHLHSDHCGGNAALQAALGAPVWVPPGQADLLRDGDSPALNWHLTHQDMARFTPQAVLRPGDPWRAGGRDWQVIEAPGHDPDSVMLFDPQARLLVSADALWENGFGVVFPEAVGEPGFDDVGRVLDTIEALAPRVVVPGHGRPFDDVAGALARARTRLAGYQADPARHARYVVKVMLKYHLMEHGREALATTLAWAQSAPILRALWQHQRPAGVASLRDWLLQALEDLAGSGALRRDGDDLVDA